MGDRFTDEEVGLMFTHYRVTWIIQVDQMFRGAPIDSQGRFDYVAFTRILKHGTKDE